MARYSQKEARDMAWKLTQLERARSETLQLLEDLLVIYPDLAVEPIDGVFFMDTLGWTMKPHGHNKFKRSEIHIVAEDFRRFEAKKQNKKRVDEAMSKIGL